MTSFPKGIFFVLYAFTFIVGIISPIMVNGQVYNFTVDKPVLACSFSPDGKYLAGLSADKVIRLWEVETGKYITQLAETEGDGDVAICYSPDGKYIASGNWDKSIKIWDVSKRKVVKRLIGHKQAVRSLSFSPDGNFLASAGWDNEIKIWFAPTGVNLKTFKGHNQCVRSLMFSSDGKHLVSGGYDLLVKVWNVSSGKEVFSVKGHKFPIETVAYHPSCKWVATAGLDNEIKLWDAFNGSLIRTFSRHKEGVYAISFSPDGAYLASAGNDNEIIIWNVSNGSVVKELQGHNQGIRALDFVYNGKYLASGGVDRALKIWNVEYLNIKPLNTLPFQVENINTINTQWIKPSLSETMVFEKNQTITITTDETSLNKFQIFINGVESRYFNGKDTVPITPKSIKKYPGNLELSFDIELKTGENEIQFFADNTEKGIYTISPNIILNYYPIKEQASKSKLMMLIISPQDYAEKKWSFQSDNTEKFTGIIKTQEGKTFSDVLIKELSSQTEVSKDKISAEILDIVNSSQPNDFVVIMVSGFFLKNSLGRIVYLPPMTTIKNIEEQAIDIEKLCKSLYRVPEFGGIILDLSRKPKLLPEGYQTVTGKETFQLLQSYLSNKKNTMILTLDNPEPLNMFDQLANSFHINNDQDKNKAIDFKEVSIFIRNFTSSQFYFRGNLFPVYFHN